MNKKMSHWGIGPLFVIFCLSVTLPALFFSYRYKSLFIVPYVPGLFYAAGGVSALFGLWLWIGAGRRIDHYIDKGILADKGFYGLVRNPVYSGILFTLNGCFLCLRSVILFPLIILFYVVLRLLLIREERILDREFGEEFRNYRKNVNSIIPKPKSFFNTLFYPEPSKKISDDLYIIRDRDVNLFVCVGGREIACIDAGYGDKRISEAFAKFGLDMDRVSSLFLTHSDIDHAGGIPLFRNAIIYLGKGEEKLINQSAFRFPLLYRNKRIDRTCHFLEEDDVLTIGNMTIRAVETPGHTSGHMAYLLNNRFLFTGDSIILQNGSVKPFYRLIAMDYKQSVRSLEKIKSIKEAEWIFTAHSGFTGYSGL